MTTRWRAATAPSFNSTLVLLEGKYRTPQARIWSSFNSTLVLLEVCMMMIANHAHSEFQFHLGSIRSYPTCRRCAAPASFNSTLVLLEVGNRRGVAVVIHVDKVSIPPWFY